MSTVTCLLSTDYGSVVGTIVRTWCDSLMHGAEYFGEFAMYCVVLGSIAVFIALVYTYCKREPLPIDDEGNETTIPSEVTTVSRLEGHDRAGNGSLLLMGGGPEYAPPTSLKK